jgi:Carboxypeptidase regulatory-like domain
LRTILQRVFILCLCAVALAQSPTGALKGKITDQTGAVIPQATITVVGADGKHTTATSDGAGAFETGPLTPGSYTVLVQAKGFAPYHQDAVVVSAGHAQVLNPSLEIQAKEEKVEVQDEGTQLDLSSSSSAGSLIIKGKDLEALSDDPDELQSELQALAGPSAGPSGGQIYIDGFTGGQLPPKSSIREIRVNQNPFSAQYDKLGYGRIEIFTKPGSDKFHGQFFFNDTNSIFNSRNPYVFVKPSYNSEIFDGNFGGPINKKASFFIDASRRNMDDFSAISAIDPSQLPNPLTANSVIPRVVESISNPRTRTNFNPRVDVQLTPSNSFTARYQITHDSEQNSGLGTFSLPSIAYNLNETEHTVQLSDTQIINPRMVNETRFQFQRDINHQLPLGAGPLIDVQQSFSFGQSSEGLVRTTENNYELQNYTSLTAHNHLIKFGARLRRITADQFTNANFNGEFIFSSVDGNPLSALQAYLNASQGLCQPPPNYDAQNCPSQFMLTIGSPNVSVGWFDAGLYAEDEWRVKPNISVTYGLRFESQNNIHDHADFAPRLGVAWGLGSDGKTPPKTVLRGGFGIFYDRFGYNLIEQTTLLNGVTQQKAVVQAQPQGQPQPLDFFSTNPNNWPSFSTLASSGSPTIYQVSPNLTSPYTIQSAASIERQITKAATLSVTYLHSHGEHQFYIDNVNAPHDPANPTTTRAQGQTYGNGNVYQYQSGGIYRQNQLIVNARINTGKRLSLFGFYTLSYANSSVSSGGSAGGFFASGGTTMASFVSNQFDPLADYGRAAFDVRHRAFLGGSVTMPYGFSLFPFVIINSGSPYNLTTGQDNNSDSIFNDRPSLANPNSQIVCTDRNDFSITQAGPLVPINNCTGPGNVTFNLRLSKTIGFGRETKGGGTDGGGGMRGPRGGGPGGGLGGRGLAGGGGNPFSFGQGTNRRYNLTFSISARNLFNTFNPGNPVGNLSSPLFGETLSVGGGAFASASANRRVDLQVRFSF